MPRHVHCKPLRRLLDGSDRASIYPAAYQRRQWGERLLGRVLEDTCTDPARPGYGERHRLLTSWREAEHPPALALMGASHARGAIEVAIAAMATHQRLVRHPRRSQQPVGVSQELYGLLIAHAAART